MLEKLRQEMPDSSEQELPKTVFMSRALPPEPLGYGMSEEEINETVEGIHSLDDLVNYFVTRDEEESLLPDSFGIHVYIIPTRIERILKRWGWRMW